MHQLTTVEAVHEAGSYLFTVDGPHGDPEEVVLVPCEDGVSAWVNRCPHEAQRFDTGDGVPMRDGEIICPRHGSLFDACEGGCDNGEAAGTTLPTWIPPRATGRSLSPTTISSSATRAVSTTMTGRVRPHTCSCRGIATTERRRHCCGPYRFSSASGSRSAMVVQPSVRL